MADHLAAGQLLRLADGETATVTGISFELPKPGANDSAFTVYNFTVDDFHSYFVAPVGSAAQGVKEAAADAVYVHNNSEYEKAVARTGGKGKGIIYKRTDPNTGEEYVGQAKSPERFAQRQAEEDRDLGVQHKYKVK